MDEISEAFDGAPLKANPKDGSERFHTDTIEHDFDLLSFWKWSTSDLVSNTARGVLAEYIVAKALGSTEDLRSEWRAFDILTPEGTKVEVKSAAYVQAWKQGRHSTIQYLVGKKLAWDADAGASEKVARRHADVYVFALLKHTIRQTIDPLNLAQWEFYVLPTSVLDERERSQHSIGLAALKAVAGEPVAFDGLKDAVKRVAPPTILPASPLSP